MPRIPRGTHWPATLPTVADCQPIARKPCPEFHAGHACRQHLPLRLTAIQLPEPFGVCIAQRLRQRERQAWPFRICSCLEFHATEGAVAIAKKPSSEFHAGQVCQQLSRLWLTATQSPESHAQNSMGRVCWQPSSLWLTATQVPGLFGTCFSQKLKQQV